MESLSPNLFVKDIKKSVDFYKKLGFKTTMSVPEKAPFVWVMMKCGNVTIMLQTLKSLGKDLPEIKRTAGGSLLFYINIKDIRKFFKKMKGKVKVLSELEKTFYGATEFSIKDVDGYVLTFAEHE